jgi:hypothetical protein
MDLIAYILLITSALATLGAAFGVRSVAKRCAKSPRVRLTLKHDGVYIAFAALLWLGPPVTIWTVAPDAVLHTLVAWTVVSALLTICSLLVAVALPRSATRVIACLTFVPALGVAALASNIVVRSILSEHGGGFTSLTGAHMATTIGPKLTAYVGCGGFVLGASLVSIKYLYGARMRSKPPRCDHCGYSREGLAPNAACPECGSPTKSAQST